MPETLHIRDLLLNNPGWTYPPLEALPAAAIANLAVSAAVLRLDQLHPVISGNKWFKLHDYLKAAQSGGFEKVVTFGGAWSNHLVAAACACQQAGIACTGIVRGEEQTQTATLLQCLHYGMELQHVSRSRYRDLKDGAMAMAEFAGSYVIPEGGSGQPGANGAAAILRLHDTQDYTHILCATGTGTTLAGLIQSAAPHQVVTGINALKGGSFQEALISSICGQDAKKRFEILNGYHFGGYARSSPALLQFMNHWYARTGIASDFVYTGKLFYAFDDLVRTGYFPDGSRVLLIHTGGLQGNASIANGLLNF